MGLFKEKYAGSIIKLYKIHNENSMDINVFKLSLDLVKQYTNETLEKVNLNMRQNDWTLNKLMNHSEKTSEKIHFLEAHSSIPDKRIIGLENKSAINYGIYETKNKKGEFTELDLNFNDYLIKTENVLNIINEYLKIMDIDYGYVFYLNEKQNWFYENKLKVSLFSVTGSTPEGYYEEREKMLEINTGYIPRIYHYKILNNEQIKALNIKDINNIHKINNKLSLYVKE
jgi:hypothetical protein